MLRRNQAAQVLVVLTCLWLTQSADAQSTSEYFVTQEAAPVQAGQDVRARLSKGTAVAVEKAQGEWLFIRVKVDGREVEGWIQKSHVAEQEPKAPTGPVRLERLLQLHKQVKQLIAASRFADAVVPAQETVAICRRLQGKEHPDTAMMINNLAYALDLAGNLPAAETAYRESLAIYQKHHGDEHPDTARSFNNLGSLLQAKGDLNGATPLLKQALAIRTKTLGQAHPDTIQSLNNLGMLLQEKKEHEAARKLLEQVVAATERLRGADHPETARALNNLGTIQESLADFRGARKSLERALAINEKVLGPDHPNTAITLNNLASLDKRQGNLAAAVRRYQRALQIREQLLGPDHPETARACNNLASARKAQGDYAGARRDFERALKTLRQNPGPEHPDTVSVQDNLGTLLCVMNEKAESRKVLEEALQIRIKTVGPKHPDTALSLNNLGTLCQSMGDVESARTFFEKALAISREVYGDSHPDTAIKLNNLGGALQAAGRLAEAKPHKLQALAIRQKVLGPNHPETATSLNNMAVLHQTLGESEAAKQLYQQALQYYWKNLGEGHPDTAVLLTNIAVLDAESGQWDAAAASFHAARRSTSQHVRTMLPGLPQREQLQYLQGAFATSLYAALSVGVQQSDNSELAARSAEWLLNGKAIAHEAMTAQTRLLREVRDSELADQAELLLIVRRELAALSMTVPSAETLEIHTNAINRLVAEEEQLSRAVTAGTGQAEVDDWRNLKDLRDAIPTEAVLVDILRMPITDFSTGAMSDPHYVAWIVPPSEEGDVQVVDLGPATAIDGLVGEVRAEITTATGPEGLLVTEGEVAATRQLLTKTDLLAAKIFRPLKLADRSAKKLILSPDGLLWLAPWAALPGETPDQYLIEVMPIQFVTSGRDLLRKEPTATTGPPLMVADPQYDLTPDEVWESMQTVLGEAAPGEKDRQRSTVFSGEKTLPEVARLPFTAAEANAIKPNVAALSGSEPRVLMQKNALESVVRSAVRPEILTLSTHGFFLPEQQTQTAERSSELRSGHEMLNSQSQPAENPLLRCGLLFAGCNDSQAGTDTAGDDGVLTGMELISTDLRGTRLVVLSACETGVGEVQNGEGVAGLRQAFLLAGAQSVVATLWPIPDAESARLMNDFFQELAAGASKSDAIREAQLRRIESRRNRQGAAHPLFWAAYTLTGRDK